MPKSLSFDLRLRVLAAIDGGLSCRQAAARFGVSASSANGSRIMIPTAIA
jgi:transposase